MNLYQFLSIEKFIDMVQRQELHFVHPSLWEDPRELWGVDCYLNHITDVEIKNVLRCARSCHFAQSWTYAKESDAMWRIYANNSSSVRICINSQHIEELDNIKMKKIEYVEKIETYVSMLKGDIEGLESAFCVKTSFFRHEKEIRLILQQQKNPYDIKNTLIHSFVAIYKHKQESKLNANRQGQNREYLVNNKSDNIQFIHNMRQRELNNIIHDDQKIDRFKKVSYGHIRNFIKSVMISPFASNWEVDMMAMFCDAHKLKFIGKSKHYSMY